MTRLPLTLLFSLSIVCSIGACTSEDAGDVTSDDACDEDKVGDSCTCDDDDEEGEFECDGDTLECVCSSASSDDEDEDEDEDEDSPTRDAGKDAGKRDGGSTADSGRASGRDGGRDAGSDGTARDSGAPPTSGRDGGSTPPVTGGDGPNPTLPAIQGTCPEFRDGTVMVAGHGSIELQVGEAGKGGPLLFYWHGTGGSALEASLRIPPAVRNEIISGGGIIASFNGSASSQSAGDCSGTAAHNMADFDAADQIAACAVENHGIDPRRIYATGCSAGGLQSGCMAQVRSSYMAAVAPNSGGVVFPQRWQDSNKPAIFTMHGGSSDWVIVAFSDTSATLDMSAKQQGSFVVNCDHQGGHCAASSELLTASWKFMDAHRFGAESPYKDGLPSDFPEYCTIY